MITAVMQPYLFPYIGYYQLVYSSDNFVLYDDVTFIKSGYINRNNILVNGKATRFTIPVPNASSNTLISDLSFSLDIKKVLKTFTQSYSKAPFYNDIMPIVEAVLTNNDRSIAEVCKQGIVQVFNHLGIDKKIHKSTSLQYDRMQNAAMKLVEITKLFGSEHYVNSIGGQELYNKDFFAQYNIELSFIKPNKIVYKQNAGEFVPNLSMIDVLMWNDSESVKKLLTEFVFV